jgi:aquaporin Z
MKQYLAEAIGTFFLVLTIGLCVNQGVLPAPLAIGGALMVMVYAGGHISGGHYNPAVTVAAWLRGALPGRQVIPYWAAQFAGAIAAAFLVYAFTGRALHVAPGDMSGWRGVLAGEVLFSFALAYVVLNVATARDTQGNSYFGVAIGSTVMVGAFAMGGISGGAFNPAVGLGPAIVEAVLGQAPYALAWIYAVGPVAGAAAAAFIFKFQHPGE